MVKMVSGYQNKKETLHCRIKSAYDILLKKYFLLVKTFNIPKTSVYITKTDSGGIKNEGILLAHRHK